MVARWGLRRVDARGGQRSSTEGQRVRKTDTWDAVQRRSL